MMMYKLLSIYLCLGLFLVGCAGSSEEQPVPLPQESVTPADNTPHAPEPSESEDVYEEPAPIVDGNVSPDQAQLLIEERSEEVIELIKNQDFTVLSEYIDPDLGVRFSPYTHVDMTNDLVFTGNQLASLFTDTTTHTWGTADGSGEPIDLTFADYYTKFIYNHDFANAESTSYNAALGHGNTINNIRDVYPTSIIVEYYFSGFDPQYDGMDWASLRLVFANKDNQWYLVGIVHDQWTI